MTLRTSAPDRAAPHDRDAERYVLGSVLIDRDAIFKVADLLRPADFYIARHQRIYAAALELLERRERIDPLTIQVELGRREELDRAGGAAYLRELLDQVPVSVDIERHAHRVRDRSLLRRLLLSARDIAADAYDEPTDIPLTLDRAEQRIFALRDEAANAQLRHIKAALEASWGQISDRVDHPLEVSGIASGFNEIDRWTEGFTRGDLVVLAARPSVGKTSLALALAYHAARRGTGVLVFSLEMDVRQIVTRFLGLTGQANILTLRTGGDVLDTGAADALTGLPVLIDDTPGISVMELRMKARRAMSRTDIGLIVVDYLQLMRTTEKEENRVQEISTITRNLKSLARELNVVVIALSQLSRAAGDFGHEPKLSTLRECVTGDTLVVLADGRRVPIRELVGTTPEVVSVTPSGRLTTATSDLVWSEGVRPVFEVRLASGRSIRATAEHRLLGFGGWKTVAELKAGDRVAIARRLPEPKATETWPEDRVALLGQLIGDGSYLVNQPMRYTNEDQDNLAFVTAAAEREFGAKVTRYQYPQHGGWSQLLITGNGNRWHPAGVNAWLRELGIFGQRSFQKRIPTRAFRLSDRSVAVLLRHLWATDGSIVVRHPMRAPGGDAVYYSTNSLGLATDVASLLLRCGIVARIVRVPQEPYRPSHNIDISGVIDQRRFLQMIGTFGPRRSPGEALLAALSVRTSNTNVDTIPHDVFALVRARMREQGITTRQMAKLRGTSYGGASHFKFAPSRQMLAGYARLLASDELLEVATSDLFWDRIREVVPVGEEEVFDLTVPATSAWLADGIVSHNSGSLEQDSDQVIMLWRDKAELTSAPQVIKGSLAKNRNGPTGIFELYFEPEQARFFSPARHDDMPV